MSTIVRNDAAIEQKYARLLVNYCLAVKSGDKVYINSTHLAESLLREVVKEIYMAGGIPSLSIDLKGMGGLAVEYASAEQLAWVNPMKKYIMENFDCTLNIRAPFEKGDDEKEPADKEKFKILQKAQQEINKIYFERIGNGSMRRALCQYPTQAGADDAEMSLEEYKNFVYQSCYLFDEDPVAKWLEVRRTQQVYVDYLNKVDRVEYKGPNIDIQFFGKGAYLDKQRWPRQYAQRRSFQRTG